ncbi:MAG: hypothetical protein JRH20_27305 [Deltaproteobacteria bacterium]|nr:hypothetical protein [Deltaproteobacteria bacterium]
MKRSITTLIVAFVAAIAFSGCHTMFGPDDERDWWYFCDDTGCYRCTAEGCTFPDQRDWCSYGEPCPYDEAGVPGDDGGLVTPDAGPVGPTTCRLTAECGTGYVCIEGSCTVGRTPCASNESCGSGAYCNDGACKDSELCVAHDDCAAKLGEGFVCDERGSCVPGTPPPKSCTSTGECGSDGLCVDALCGSCEGDCGGGLTCEFQVHCGDERSCVDGRCTSTCQTKADCGSAQVCQTNLCLLPTEQCVADSDCGSGQACVDQVCYVDCTPTGSCDALGDVCSGTITVGERTLRVCRPDTVAALECTLSKDCGGSEQCVNGVCRTVCITVDDCAACDDGPVCGTGGFCMTAEEANPECRTVSDCTDGKSCVDTRCMAL